MLTARTVCLVVVFVALCGGTARPQRLDLTDPLANDFADLQGAWERPAKDPANGPDRLVIRRGDVDVRSGRIGFGAQLIGLVQADGVRRMELKILGKKVPPVPYRFENGCLLLTPDPVGNPLDDIFAEIAGKWRRAAR